MGYKVIIQGDDDAVLFKWPVEEETAKSLIVTAVSRNAPRPREVHAHDNATSEVNEETTDGEHP